MVRDWDTTSYQVLHGQRQSMLTFAKQEKLKSFWHIIPSNQPDLLYKQLTIVWTGVVVNRCHCVNIV